MGHKESNKHSIDKKGIFYPGFETDDCFNAITAILSILSTFEMRKKNLWQTV